MCNLGSKKPTIIFAAGLAVLCLFPERTSGGKLKLLSPSVGLSIFYKSFVSHNSKTDKGNLIRLYRKIK